MEERVTKEKKFVNNGTKRIKTILENGVGMEVKRRYKVTVKMEGIRTCKNIKKSICGVTRDRKFNESEEISRTRFRYESVVLHIHI